MNMIVDRLENRNTYKTIGHGIPEALEYLAKTDFSKIAPGKYPIDGDRLFAVVQRYEPKPISEGKWEYHRKYLDVQYMVSGVERMGYAPQDDSLPVEQEYSDEKDCGLVRAAGPLVPVGQKMFAIFFPNELHAPCLSDNDTGPGKEVFKIVVKCLWDA
jgi:YhcH/YjgK/YiaL family protein